MALGELGPGDNIGLVASKTCATPIRGQYYAIAAAAGKIGAFVGTYLFPIIMDDAPTKAQQGQYPFWVASSLCVFSAFLAFFCLPHIGQDTIDHEDVKFRAYLAEKGYDTTKMGLTTAGTSVVSDVSDEVTPEKEDEPAKESTQA